jgi:ribose transport system substrate-binding protein
MDDDPKSIDSIVEEELSRREALKRAGAATGAVVLGSLWTPPKSFGIISKKKYKIAIVPKGLDNPVFALAKLGLEKRAKELGDVEPIFTAGTKTDTAADIRAIEGLISEKVDAIGISCNDPKAYVSVINKAVKKGIKVMCWDSDAPSSKRSVFYGVNSYQVGKKMGKAMNRLLGGKGKIVIISGDAAALNLNLRIKGAKTTLGSGIKIVKVAYTKDDIPTAVAATENAIRANPDLKGLLMVGGWALFSNEGATPELVKHKGKIKVVSFDPLKPVVAYLRDGIVQSVWTQDYWGWGYQSTTILYGLLHHKRWHKLIPQPSVEVTKKDWHLWQKRWAATSKGVNAAAKVWGEKPFKPPGPGTGPTTR